MLSPKMMSAAALLATIPASLACSCSAVFWTSCQYVAGEVDELSSSDTSVVVRATPLSRSPQDDINDDVTYTIEVTKVYTGEIGGESEISFVTPGNEALCGVTLEIGADYVLGLSPTESGIDGELTLGACGLYRKWDGLRDKERAELEVDCGIPDPSTCYGSCDESQECVQYERNGKYYCSDTCNNNPCASGEVCSIKPRKWCRTSGFEGCPERRSCRAS